MNVSVDPRKPRVSAPAPAPKRRSLLWIWIVIAVVVAAGVYYALRKSKSAAGADASGPAAGGRPGAGGFSRGGRNAYRMMTVVVTAAEVTQGDLPDFITALGTVTALNTATVHSRVDGQLVKINFEEGQEVKQGDVLAELDARPFQVSLEQAQGQLARDEATLANSRLDYQRYQDAREAVTQQQIDAAKAAVAQNEGAVKADQGAVASAELQLSFCQVVAPINGVVGLRQVDVGNLIHSSDTNGIVVITQIQPIAVRFSIPEDNVPAVVSAIARGEKLPAQIYDRSLSKHITNGELVATDNQIDTTTGTLRLKAVVPNEKHELFSNQFVNVRLLVNTEKGVLLIPTSAIQLNGQDSFVFVVSDDNTVHRTAIKTGNTEGTLTVVSHGLTLGQKVVSEGLDRLQDGATVQVRTAADEAAANAPAPQQQKGKWHKRNGGQRQGQGGS